MSRKILFLLPIVILLLTFLFLFNLRYLSRFFDWDSVVYTLNIEKSLKMQNLPLQKNVRAVFYNPHHIGFESSGYAYMTIVKKLFGADNLMFKLRLRILASAIVFLFLFFILHYILYKQATASLLLMLAIFFSQAFWFYTNHNDTPLIPAAMISLTFLMSLFYAKRGFDNLGLVILFIFMVQTIFFHQSNALFLPLIPVAILVSNNYRKKPFPFGKKLIIASVFIFAVTFVVTISYLVVGLFILEKKFDARGENNFTTWLFLYATQGSWGTSNIQKDYILHFYRGIGDAFLNFSGINARLRVDFSQPFTLKNAPYNINLLFWLCIFSLALVNIRNLWRKYHRELIIFAFWLIPSLVFYTWWQGYFFEFWVSTSIALWLFSFWTLTALPCGIFRRTHRSLIHLVYVFAIFFLFSVNFTLSSYPRSERVKIGVIGQFEKFAEDTYRLARENIYVQPFNRQAPSKEEFTGETPNADALLRALGQPQQTENNP